MKNQKKKRIVFCCALLSLLLFTALWSTCAGSAPQFVTTNMLPPTMDLSELTPIENKRFEKVINSEVSPCGDDISLAEALLNPQRCPLAPLAGRFVVSKIMEDYNEEEISKAYLARYAAVKGLELPIDGAPQKGGANPVVTLVVFTDFQCPFCSRAATALHELLRYYPDEISLVHKNFPLPSHPFAEMAARAAFAAQQQGKFWAMHDTLFSATRSQMNRDRIQIMAIGLGLDMEKFEEDLASPAATAAIEADKKLGEQLGISGTPTIYVNGRLLEEGFAELELRIQEELLRDAAKNPTKK